MDSSLKTVLEVLKLSTEYLAGHGIENPRREAEFLLADTLKVERIDIYLSHERPLEQGELDDLCSRLKRKAAGEPWQYIEGSVKFFGCRFKVDPHVLIPRQETEILVDTITDYLQKEAIFAQDAPYFTFSSCSEFQENLPVPKGCAEILSASKYSCAKAIEELAFDDAFEGDLSLKDESGSFFQCLPTSDAVEARRLYKRKTLLDLCTGSGCMGIALKKRFPALNVYLSDISPEALAVARENAAANDVEVVCLQGDLFAPLDGIKVDYLVCNPPYIAEAEYEHLSREVKDFEPRLALVSGESGLEFYERLALELPGHLNLNARIFLEIGSNQGPAVIKLFSQPIWKDAALLKDWSGHDRFLIATYFP